MKFGPHEHFLLYGMSKNFITPTVSNSHNNYYRHLGSVCYNIAYCRARQLAKTINFDGYGTHGIKEELRQTHSVEVCETVYHTSKLHNHHMKQAKLEHKCN